MAGLSSWAPYTESMQSGHVAGDNFSGLHCGLWAGPPFLRNLGSVAALGGSNDEVVYPIGATQNLAISSNRVFTRIFEIGSDRSFFIPGRTVSQMTLARVYLSGPSLLRLMYAYYQDAEAAVAPIQALWDHNLSLDGPALAGPSPDGLNPVRKPGLHRVRIPPGFGNVFINLASDMFQYPFGMLVTLRSNEEQNLAAYYFEQAVIPTHSWAVDAQGLIAQESVGIQFERMVPLPLNAIATMRGLQPGDNPTALTQGVQTAI